MNRFLTLLVTQLKNQDPLQPMDSTQFTTQLVQFASVEQQIQQNANLEKILTSQQNGQFASLINFVGTTVETNSDTLTLQDGSAKAQYTLPSEADSVKLTVSDASGRSVFSTTGDTSAGSHAFVWDGRGSDGSLLSSGSYTLQVSATDKSGNSLDVTQSSFGKVTGIAQDASGPILELGDTTIAVSDVLSVADADTTTP